MDETTLRKEILDKVRQLASLRKQPEFAPGKTKIAYAGRVYDHEEMVALVDSSLDFWLTAGRYANEFEEKFAKSFGTKYCSLANSGSSANLLAISALTGDMLGRGTLRAGIRSSHAPPDSRQLATPYSKMDWCRSSWMPNWGHTTHLLKR